ncbi:hypothetical protein QBC38DRAFT_172356 [Podospora fimiseda]|uniref:Thiaminase-2/PQQC domain-containing protein n=1 Tax=Podospora fimiseda TaxID=252190 RepID=A0AAN7BCF9_9PEZI|nr:hypothetical protein QBC38DRAFT_172356 [Podospora fimiseda]
MAQSVLPGSAYQDFAKQDYLYLIENVRFKALRFAKLKSTAQLEEWRAQSQRITSAVNIVEDWRKTCIEDLKIPASEMKNIEPSAAQIGYASFLNGQTILDDWFSLYITTIPCIYGWSQIAKRLDEDPRTDHGTPFYKTFIKPNLESESAKKLCQFIEANRKFWSSGVTENVWNTLFRTALKFEIALFDSVLVERADFALPPDGINRNN